MGKNGLLQWSTNKFRKHGLGNCYQQMDGVQAAAMSGEVDPLCQLVAAGPGIQTYSGRVVQAFQTTRKAQDRSRRNRDLEPHQHQPSWKDPESITYPKGHMRKGP